MLVTAAAQRWNRDASTCHRGKGCRLAPTHRPPSVGYGKLVDAAAKLPVPENVALKAAADFKLIGKPASASDDSRGQGHGQVRSSASTAGRRR